MLLEDTRHRFQQDVVAFFSQEVAHHAYDAALGQCWREVNSPAAPRVESALVYAIINVGRPRWVKTLGFD